MTATRLVAYTPNGASLGPLPTPLDLQASFPLSDVGALTFSYPLDAPRSTLLGSPVEVAVEVTTDGGATWAEPESGRFLYWRDSGDPVKRDAWSVECPAYVQRLSKAVVPFTGTNAEGNREFVTKTAGFILHTLFTEAQARGALAGMTWDFTAATDSAGNAWGRDINIAYAPGKDFLAILREWADLGWVDFRTQGRTVQVYTVPANFYYLAEPQPGNPMSEDRTVGANPVALRFGRDLAEAPFRRTWEGLADTAFVTGDNLTSVERTIAGALKPWGRQETFVSAAGVDNTGTLNALADSVLRTSQAERAEYTYGLVFTPSSPLPFRDYGVGDWVFRAVDGAAPVRMRVRQITLTRDTQGNTSGNVVLNDKFLEGDVTLQRRIAAIMGGQAGTSGIPSTPPPGNDILAPAQVVGITGTTDVYFASGNAHGQVTLDWPDVTTNADGTPATDVAKYQVQQRRSAGTTDADFVLVDEPATSRAYRAPLEVNTHYTFRVRAVDTVGNEGAWSANYGITTTQDTTGPVQPQTPTGQNRLGVLQVTWSGKNQANGGAMDADFLYCEVHVSSVNGFTPTLNDPATKRGVLHGAGNLLVTGLAYPATYYARLLPVDRSGNAGTVSAQVAIAIAPLVDVSNFPDDAVQTLVAREGQFLTVTTDQLIANGIATMFLDSGEILGAVIRGSTISTDYYGTGNRMEMLDDGSAGVIRMYSGHPNEQMYGFLNPGVMNVSGYDVPYTVLSAPKIGTLTAPYLQMLGPDPTGAFKGKVDLTVASGGQITISAPAGLILFQGDIRTTASLEVDNDAKLERNVWVGSDQRYLNNWCPVGTIIMWAGSATPSGWLKCDGSTFSSATYPALFNALGSTTLPDLRGRFPLGAGTYASLGESEQSAESVRTPRHTHGIPNESAHDHSISAASMGTTNTAASGSGSANGGYAKFSSADGHNHGGATGNGGAHSHGGATGMGPKTGADALPFYALHFYIKAN